jgi:crotonobetainyl-CoA:carnitine CoA-transferase CaiB-like acyl-CoA transferase
MSKELTADVETFFQTYCAAFEALDTEAIADCVAYPSHIISDSDEVSLIAIANRQQCLATMSRVVELHRQLGAPSGRIHDLSILQLSPRLVQASLRMDVRDRASNHLYDFQAIYSLAKISGAWRIVAIAHNQIPRLSRCLSEQQSGAMQ